MKLLLMFCSILLLHTCIGEDAQTSTSPKPTVGPTDTPLWMGNDTTGHTCVMLKAVIQLNFTGNIEPWTNLSVITVPSNAIVDSDNCTVTNGTQHLTLTFENPSGYKWKLEFLFTGGVKSDQHMLQDATITLIHNSTENVSGTASLLLSLPKGYSYKCKTREEFNVTGIDSQSWPFSISKLSFEDLQWEAFMNTATPAFETDHVCTADKTTNDLVPIIVGACLAALVVIVLIAYLVGRAKAKRSTGYESV